MKLLFIGTHGQNNFGDDLLMSIFVSQLSEVVDKFFINTYLPSETASRLASYNVEVFHTRHEPHKLISKLCQADAILFGGGSILKELYVEYGGRRYSTLRQIEALSMIGHAIMRKPIFLANIGAGPLPTDRGMRIVARIVRQTDFISVRDQESYDILEQLAPNSTLSRVPDAAFTTNRSYFNLSPEKKKKHITDIGGLRKIGINICRNIGNDQNWAYFISNLAEDLDSVLEANPEIELVGVPLQYDRSDNDDSAALEELRSALCELRNDANFTIVKPRSINELGSLVDEFDIIIAARLHALIVATVLQTPFIALEYDVKVRSVVKDLGFSRFGIDINEKFARGEIKSLIVRLARAYTVTQNQLSEQYKSKHREALQGFSELTSRIKALSAQ